MQVLLKHFSVITEDHSEFEAKSVALGEMIKQKNAALFVDWLEQATQSSIS